MEQAQEPQRQAEAEAPPAGAATPARGRLVRRTDNKVIAGVASGIADALGIKPVLVRIAFVVLTAFGGLGAWLYALGWLLLPPHRPRHVKLALLWAMALLLAAGIAGGVTADASERFARRLWETRWAWPLAAAVAITVLISQPARRRWPQPARRIQLGFIVVAGLCGLVAAIGLRGTLLTVGLAAVGGLLAAWVLVLPRQLAPPLPTETLESLEARDRLEVSDARLKLQNDLRTTALQAIAGLAVLAGAVLAFQQLTADRQQATATQELTRQGQTSERFTRAIDQLGSDRVEVRLGGIYGLEQIAQQAPDNRLAVVEVLVAYLHRSSPAAARPATDPAEPATQPVEPLGVRAPDVQAALTVLARRKPWATDLPLDLSGLDLRGADVSAQVTIRSSPAMEARYVVGELRGADLRGTDLRGATFSGVYLHGADFGDADLRGADFERTGVPMGAPIESYPGQVLPEDRWDSGIEEAFFRGALADSSTKWGGLDWRAEGVRML